MRTENSPPDGAASTPGTDSKRTTRNAKDDRAMSSTADKLFYGKVVKRMKMKKKKKADERRGVVDWPAVPELMAVSFIHSLFPTPHTFRYRRCIILKSGSG